MEIMFYDEKFFFVSQIQLYPVIIIMIVAPWYVIPFKERGNFEQNFFLVIVMAPK